MVFSYFLRFFLTFYLQPMEKRYFSPAFLFFGFCSFFFLSSAWAMEGDREEKRILLSIDGGGYRGLIPAILLEDLEKSLSETHGYDVSLSQHLDAVAGTSTGSILAMGLAVSHPDYPRYPRYQASIFPTLYTENGKRIFSRVGWRSLWGIWRAKYDRTFLDNLLETHFGEATLKNGVLQKEDGALVCTLVPAYRIKPTPEPHYFCNFPETVPDHKIREIVGASTAAPTYFPAKEVPEGSGQFYIDGGVFRNNPASVLTLKMGRRFPGPRIATISMGTGEELQDFKKLQNAGKVQVVPIVDLLMTASQQTVDEDMKDMDAQYIRIQPPLEEASLDKTDDATTAALRQAAKDVVTAHEAYEQAKEALSQVCAAKKESLRSAIGNSVQDNRMTLENQPILSGRDLTASLLTKISDHASQLTSLTLKKCNIWDGDNIRTPGVEKLTIQKVCEILKKCPNIQEVDVSQNRIGDAGLLPLEDVVSSCAELRTLVLQDNGLTLGAYDGIKQLVFPIDPKNLRITRRGGLSELDLAQNSQLFKEDLVKAFDKNEGFFVKQGLRTYSLIEDVYTIRFKDEGRVVLRITVDPRPLNGGPAE